MNVAEQLRTIDSHVKFNLHRTLVHLKAQNGKGLLAF